MALAITGPGDVFADDASKLFDRIAELERMGAPKENIRKAREYANKALAQMDIAFASLPPPKTKD